MDSDPFAPIEPKKKRLSETTTSIKQPKRLNTSRHALTTLKTSTETAEESEKIDFHFGLFSKLEEELDDERKEHAETKDNLFEIKKKYEYAKQKIKELEKKSSKNPQTEKLFVCVYIQFYCFWAVSWLQRQ